MSMSDDDVMPKGSALPPTRRIEVFTGSRRRRDWSAAEKAAIVAESYGTASVCDVARRHDLTPSQLFTWRRQARRLASPQDEPSFVPAIIGAQESVTPVRESAHVKCRGGIELEIDGVVVRVGSGSDRAMIAAVIAALKAIR